MQGIRHRRSYCSHIQFRGNLSTTSPCIIISDKLSGCSISDEESEKLSQDRQLHGCIAADNQTLDDHAPLDAYFSALEKCISQKNLAFSLRLHSLLVNCGHELNSFVSTSLVRLFAACGSLPEADQVFRKLHEPRIFAWGAIISAHSKCGLGENAIELYKTFLSSNVQPDGHIYVAALQACANAATLPHGRRIHAQIIESGLHLHVFLLNGIISMYLRCRSIYDASIVFDTSQTRDAVSWSTMMEGCNQYGWFYKTLLLFTQMQAEGFLIHNVAHVCVLQASSCLESLYQGKMFHALSFEIGLEKDLFVLSTMIHMYCQCGRLDDAVEVFNARREVRDVVIWRAMLTGFASCGHLKEAFQLFIQMQQQEGLAIGKRTYISILNACSNASALYYGQIIHTYLVESELKVDKDMGQALIGLYTNCGETEIASKVFNGLQSRDVVTWTAIMSGYADRGHYLNVLQLLCQMYNEGIEADEVVFSTVLKVASIQGYNLDLARVVHTSTEVNNVGSDAYVRNLLAEFYVRFEMYEDADWFVHNLVKKILSAEGCLVLKLPKKLMEDVAMGVLHLCLILEDLEGAQLVHFLLTESDYRWTEQAIGSFISVYASHGMLDDAYRVLAASQSHTFTGWSLMIDGYIQHGRSNEAFQLFCRMHQQGFQLDQKMYISISKAFFTSSHLMYGRMLHARIRFSKVRNDRGLGIALIEMYARCDSTSEAQRVFDTLLVRDTMAWNALIAGYVSSGHYQEAYELIQAMEKVGCKPDAFTCVGILKACSTTYLLCLGKLVHHFAYESGYDFSAALINSLTNMYVSCGSLDDAECLIDYLPFQSKDTWGLIISRHAEIGCFERALLLFQKMQQAGVTPDTVTIMSSLKACTNSASSINGMLLHSFLLLSNLKSNMYLANSLITMYFKCGSLKDALKMFHCLDCKDTTTWNAMIAGCAYSNNCELAWHYYRGMQNKKVRPDAMTFLCILSVCSHMGSVKDGLHQFHCMIQQHGIIPTAEHYNCVIDLLGRAGSLLKAEDLLCSLPFLHDSVGWMSLLGHCKLHENTIVGNKCINYAGKYENRIASGYLLMEHIFFHSGHVTKADDAESLRSDFIFWTCDKGR
ncbi:hypothetical protein L7F22_033914 [Adiantum nelumboides]|nr:hypothetical protein [Adiantum nelumboides]